MLFVALIAQVLCGQIPTQKEVTDLLAKEPITVESWPVWRGRLLGWMDDRSHQTDPGYEAARSFFHNVAKGKPELNGPLAKDALAWYFLGSSFIFRDPNVKLGHKEYLNAMSCFRRSLQLDPKFARTYRNLAVCLLFEFNRSKDPLLLQEIENQINQAAQLDPKLQLDTFRGQVALNKNQFKQAEDYFRKALAEDPKDVSAAVYLMNAYAVDSGKNHANRANDAKALIERFPNDGLMHCLCGIILANERQYGAGAEHLAKARSLGVDPRKVFDPNFVDQIEEQSKPNWMEMLVWGLLGFAAFYAVIMAAMALTGLILASKTRGTKALQLLSGKEEEYLDHGHIARASHESALAKSYGYALVLGLIFFYLAIPFVLLGLVGGTVALILLVLSLGRIPIKLLIVIAIFGAGAAWAVLKSIFTKPASGSFGVLKSDEKCPRLHALVRDVARRVDTEAVHEIYLAPGSAIGVHQEGRGPFGMFGVKKRVLTLGLSTMRYLTQSELQAILAHEYAHFSHSDTFYSRFIYQVHISIEQSLWGMGQAGGVLNYINPFYWFLWLYYKSYSLLSAGFSRSREFLADRMASFLYGSDNFASALSKVCTDGALFEITIYDNISKLLAEQKAFINMYEAFKGYRDDPASATERDELYQKLLKEEGSLFASHPTFGERIAAIMELPKAPHSDERLALELLDNPEEVEKELTKFLTDYMDYLNYLQAQAAAAEAQGY